ncbi:MAG TPA: S8 family serine peptidase [Miltoncostaeaceae bacterium]|nr:S8 family serine peptidase [Miltoncostaeaceae bacterium]
MVPAGLKPPIARVPPIAIIETGFDPDHPDMAGGWVEQRRYGPLPNANDDEAVAEFLDGVAHGTAVAGVIGAPRDGRGLEGILPGARVRVYGSSGLCHDVATAIRLAVRDGARVINASYGFGPFGACREHRDATSYAFGAGATVVAASGNFRPVQPWIQPGNDLHVLTVNALNALDQPTGFSHQNLYSDLSAPGESILVAVPSWADVEDGVADGYSRWHGTSFAAPMVSAAAAWVIAENPRLSADQVAEILRRSARDLGRPGWDISTGWGALDLRAAVRAPAPLNDPFEPNDDIRWVDGSSGFRADRPFLRTSARQAVRARIDVQKDPVDVYPVWVPGGGAVSVRLTPRFMPSDLFVWPSRAQRAHGRGAIAKSRLRGLARERLTIANDGGRGAKVWVEVRGVRGRALSGAYSLELARR